MNLGLLLGTALSNAIETGERLRRQTGSVTTEI